MPLGWAAAGRLSPGTSTCSPVTSAPSSARKTCVAIGWPGGGRRLRGGFGGASQPAERARCPGARPSSPLGPRGDVFLAKGAMFLARRAMFLTKRRCSSQNGRCSAQNGRCSAATDPGAHYVSAQSLLPACKPACRVRNPRAGRPDGPRHGQEASSVSPRVHLHMWRGRGPLQAALASPTRGETASPERRGSCYPSPLRPHRPVAPCHRVHGLAREEGGDRLLVGPG